jgi:hypothetical protein
VINLTPQKTKTLVLPLTAHEVLFRLDVATNPPDNSPHKFTPLMGRIGEDRFQLALRARRPNGFVPIATGKIEKTSSGCLIFLTYTLMPSTRFYLQFCSLVILISGAVAAFYYKDVLLSLAAIASVAIINLIAWANFKLHRKPLHNLLLEVLE